jgi:hypothetical protein
LVAYGYQEGFQVVDDLRCVSLLYDGCWGHCADAGKGRDKNVTETHDEGSRMSLTVIEMDLSLRIEVKMGEKESRRYMKAVS